MLTINMRSYIIFLILILSATISSAQDYFEWQRFFGVAANEEAHKCIQTEDGGYLLIGQTNHFDQYHIDNELYILKLSSRLRVEWECNIPGNGSDYCHDALETDDGYLLVGYHIEAGQDDEQGHLWKLNAEGELQWERIYPQNHIEILRVFAHPDQDNQFVCILTHYRTTMLILDQNGEIQRMIHLNERETLMDVIMIEDEMVALSQVWLFSSWILSRYNIEGEEVWRHEFLEGQNNHKYYSVSSLSDGRLLVSGIVDFERVLIMFSAEGEIEWENRYPTERHQNYNGAVQVLDERIVCVQAHFRYIMLVVDFDGNAIINQQIDYEPEDQPDANPWGVSDAFYLGDNKLLAFGSIGSDDSRDYMTLEYNLNGSIEDLDTFGFPGGCSDIPKSVKLCEDGGFIIGAQTNRNFAWDWDPMLIKVDSDGQEQWTQIYETRAIQICAGAVESNTGGYHIGGSIEREGGFAHQFWILTTDSVGEIQRDRQYFDRYHDSAEDMIKTSSGEIAIAGGERNYSKCILTDDQGNLIASMQHSSPRFISITELPENRFALLKSDGSIIVTDNQLNEINTFSGLVGDFNHGQVLKIRALPNGDILLLGSTEYRNRENRAFLSRFHPNGELLWSMGYIRIDLFYERGNAKGDVIIPNDSTLFICSNKDIVKMTHNGWRTARINLLGIEEFPFEAWEVLEDGSIILAGRKNDDIWLTRINADSFTPLRREFKLLTPQQFSIGRYPNPFNSSVTITANLPRPGRVDLSVFNCSGQKLKSMSKAFHPIGVYEQKIDFTTYPTGNYWATLYYENMNKTVKLTHLK